MNEQNESTMGNEFFNFKSTILLSIILTFTTMAFAKTEQQKFRVVHSEKEFEIRFYPAATLATVHSDAKTYRELSGSGFRVLAGYIFGKNKSETQIAMTAPVHMDISSEGSSMSFVMPEQWREADLPEPVNPEVRIEKAGDEYVAAIRFGGYASDGIIREYSGKLRDLLDERGIVYKGNFRFLGYNPPFQPFFRRNEIIVQVEWRNQGSK